MPWPCQRSSIDRPNSKLSRLGVEGVAGFADDGLGAVDGHDRDHAEAVGLADMDELIELGCRAAR